jgi:peptidoglycan/LPS O-acetylase OafA/YrhL
MASDWSKLKLEQALKSKKNGFNTIRLILSLAVLVSHVGWINGRDNEFRVLGPMAVNAFFVLSGFLISKSWDSRPITRMFWKNRFLRIFPAYLLCLVMTALVFGPMFIKMNNLSLQNYFGQIHDGPVSYVFKNVFLVLSQPGISGTPHNLPIGENWNIPLWTLKYEVMTYILIYFVGIMFTYKNEAKFTIFILSLTLLNIVNLTLFHNSNTQAFLRFSSFSFGGVLIYVFRRKITINFAGMLLSGLWSLTAFYYFEPYKWITNYFALFASIPFAYLVISIGIMIRRDIPSRYDFSYGIYIYGAPCTVIVASTNNYNLLGIQGSTAISLALTLVFAIGSRIFCENYFLNNRNKLV